MTLAYMESAASSGLFKYIAPSQYSTVWSELNMAPRSYEKQQIIYGQDEPVRRAAIVHSGLVKGERLHPEGASDLAYYYAKGELFAFEGALSGKKTSPMQLTAEEKTVVIFFDAQRLFSSSFESALSRGLLELLANDDIKKLYRIEILSKRGLRDRILSHLHMLSARSGSNTFSLGMSREQLAHYLCVNRTALSYELNQMKREGIIDMDKRNIKLLHPDGTPYKRL